MTFRSRLVSSIKKIIYSGGEKYEFGGVELLFMPNTRPVKRKYINDQSDVVRNDVLQIFYMEKNFLPEHVLWDIGSHHGHYSVFAASVVKGKDQVFSFEPDDSARNVQTQNILLNHFDDRVQIFDYVVSGTDGTIHFMDEGGNANSHIVYGDEISAAGTVVRETRCLDSLLNVLPRPDFVKIDTEGAEIDILRGGSRLLSDKNVKFICELHPFAWESFGVKYNEFVDILNRYGRKIELLDNRKQVKDLPYYGTVLF
jgi:FkbM family methyltransferase